MPAKHNLKADPGLYNEPPFPKESVYQDFQYDLINLTDPFAGLRPPFSFPRFGPLFVLQAGSYA